MILTETNGGTRLSSTRYMHYGTTTARSKFFLAPYIVIVAHLGAHLSDGPPCTQPSTVDHCGEATFNHIF